MGGNRGWLDRSSLAVWVAVFLCILPLSSTNQYCSITRDHTLCKFQGIGPRCKGLYANGIPAGDRDLILGMHNRYRQLVATGGERRGRPGPQPTAANMRQMEWDDELAATAQRLADQCKYTHDCLNCRKVDRFLTGQNLYQFSENLIRDGSNWPQAISAWYDEVADFNSRTIDSFVFVKALGHFTQMLWADTYRLGCGYAYYNEGKWNRKLYICNYGPAGNIITLPMYQRGSPCSACPEGTSCSNQYPGLCTGYTSGAQFFVQQPLPTLPPTYAPVPTTTTTPRPTTTTTRRTTTTTTTTPRPITTTTNFPQLSFNEIESNDINEIGFRFGGPPRKNSNRQRQNQLAAGGNSKQFTTTTPRSSSRLTTIGYIQSGSYNRQYGNTVRPATFSNQIRTTRRPPPPPTTRTTTTTTTTLAPFYPGESSGLSSPSNLESQVLASLNRNRFSGASQTGGANAVSSTSLAIRRLVDPPVTTLSDMNSILLFCDFDFAKCPIRFTGDAWNYTVVETPGYGNGFETVVSPTHVTNLYIRSIMTPSRDGNVCLYFRYINYRFSPDGTQAKSGSKPLGLRVTVGTLRQKPKVVEIPDLSVTPRDWLTARVQFNNVRSMFLLIFQLPSNYLQDNVYLAIDDVLVTQGLCHI